ncbi:unnamed protein product [Chondrus crispus]|uniref:Uncharacterized protein n=1 Tax=Chondrus crispus TaxID=2769 RepID=R7QGM7_CHOCR|nr:unnamed protein product [Chondrus crispus]CDF37672.1 unnamed protein product [Chondrus crispus]|eukprot:XP_005717543.1 unnamed protein product [Chondrus crispus]
MLPLRLRKAEGNCQQRKVRFTCNKRGRDAPKIMIALTRLL